MKDLIARRYRVVYLDPIDHLREASVVVDAYSAEDAVYQVGSRLFGCGPSLARFSSEFVRVEPAPSRAGEEAAR